MYDLNQRLDALSPEKRKLMELALKNKGLKSTETGFASIPKAPPRDYYPLSSAQKRLFILNQMAEIGTSYNIPAIYTIEGALDRNRFQAVLNQLIQRHESFRTSFELKDGEPIQRILPEVNLDILKFQIESEEDLTDGVNDNDTNVGVGNFRERSQIQNIINAFIQPFDLSHPPLLRVGLVKLPNEKHLLLLDMSHIIADGTSMAILIQEFISLYHGEDIPELRIQYKDYAAWQNHAEAWQELFKAGQLRNQEEYWLQTLTGELQPLNLPTDYPRPVARSFEGERITFQIEPQITQRINQLATETGTTLYMILLAALNILLFKYTSQEDIVIGSPIAGRPHADLEKIIGMFVNTLAMRNYPAGGKTVIAFLAEVKENALQAYQNQSYPFEELVEKLNLERDLSRNPLFDVMFVLQNTGVNLNSARDLHNHPSKNRLTTAPNPGESSYHQRETHDLQFIPYPFDPKTAKFDLTLEATETNRGMMFSFEYCTKLFKRETMNQMAGHFIRILTAITVNPELRLSEIEFLSPEERKQLLVLSRADADKNLRQEFETEKTIHELFEAQAQKTPDQIAVVFETKQLAYAELNGRANQLARYLRTKGLKPNQIVAIMVERSPEMIVGLMSILKAGGAFLPIAPDYPEERIRYILKDSNTDILLTQGHMADKLQFKGVIVDLDDEHLYQGNSANLEQVNQSHDLLYLIYTSGTTGRPKGVMLEHRNLVNLIHFQFTRTNIDLSGKVLQFATISFDVCYQEIFSTLLAGGQLYLISETLKRDVVKLLEFIGDNQIPVIFWPTAFLKFVANEPEYLKLLPACIQHLITAGEQLIVSEPLRNYLIANRVYLHNHYGPSETHVVTTYTMDSTAAIPEIPPIGKPVVNVAIYILDPYGNLAPLGVGGELFIAGANTGRGYLNRPELTAEKFVVRAFRETPLQRMYRTGDLARRLPDGRLEFLGRIDHQVKIRGFRIELGEIEAQLLKHEAVKSVIVVPRQDLKNNKFLCAYFSGDRELSVRELREFLERTMPEYMIPSYFVQLENLPLTPNGKIDRKALPEVIGSLNTGAGYEPPRNVTEQTLVNIWQDLLGVERIGIDDNFFDLGGHSLKAVSIVSRAKQENIQVTSTEIFKYRTIRKIVENAVENSENATYNVLEDETDSREFPGNCAGTRTILEYKLQINVTSFLFRALPLGIVYAHEQMLPWLYQHFIQICAQTGDDGRIVLDYGETIDAHREVIDHVKLGYAALAEVTDIVSYLQERINLKQYVIICLDEYYLTEKANYQKKHFVHESMIYGYDSSKQQFIGCGFNREQILDRLIFSYDEVSEGFEAGKIHFERTAGYAKYQAVQLLSVIERESAIEFSLGVFCKELNNYLFSLGEKKRDCILVRLKDRSDGIPQDRIKHGLNAYIDLVHALEKMLQGKLIIDYRSFHFIAEHKRGLYERLTYIAAKYPVSPDLVHWIEDYRQVIEITEKVRIKIFEMMHAGQDLAENYQEIIKQIIQAVKVAQQKEQELLSKILKQLN